MLRLLVERMGDVGWHLDEYSDEDLLTLSAALKGTAIMMAMDTGNSELLGELTGRTFHEVDPTEWLRKFRGDEQP